MVLEMNYNSTGLFVKKHATKELVEDIENKLLNLEWKHSSTTEEDKKVKSEHFIESGDTRISVIRRVKFEGEYPNLDKSYEEYTIKIKNGGQEEEYHGCRLSEVNEPLEEPFTLIDSEETCVLDLFYKIDEKSKKEYPKRNDGFALDAISKIFEESIY